MFALAILIGIYSYLIFALGLLGLLYKNIILITTLVFLIFIFPFIKIKKYTLLIKKINFKEIIPQNKMTIFLFFLIIIQALINLIGVLGPELSFDALWYHLTLPKIYLTNHSIFYISGGLFYYSVMPKLTEMIYISALVLQNEILAKFIHYLFGILLMIVLYKFSRKYFSSNLSLLTVCVFCSNLVFNWQSITAYVDLARTFFETLALFAFINWWEKEERKWLVESAVMMGLAVSVKLLAISSIFIFSFLIIYRFFNKKNKLNLIMTNVSIYWFMSLLIALPWFVFSFINTGNPFYPLFTSLYRISFNKGDLLNSFHFLIDIWHLFTHLADPISPLYIIFLPIIFFVFKKIKTEIKVIAFYAISSLIIWYFIPRSGGGRFILPYLPAFSILIISVIQVYKNEKLIKKVSMILIITTSLLSIFYRGVVNAKYIPVILNLESKNQFLSKNLNYSFGDFYDIDNYFKNHIKLDDKVLLYGFHNLYYVNFPFIDSSYIKKGDKFNYVAVQNQNLPKRFNNWSLIYQNQKTNVKLYWLKGEMCEY